MKNIKLTILALGILFTASFFLINGCIGNAKTNLSRTSVVFPNVNYAKVVAYDYEGLQGDNIYEKGKLFHNIKKSKELSAEQISNLLDVLNDESSYGGSVTRCFKPRLGIVFYDAQGKYLAQVSICFECNQHQSSPAILAQDNTRKVTNLSGYSEEGRSKLIALCKSLDFSNCGSSNPDASSNEDSNEIY